MAPEAESIWAGTEGDYDWLVSTCSLGDLLSVCPELIVDRFVAVTALDSGSLKLTEEEKANGWTSQFGIAYSPRVAAIETVPFDNCYDEWYVFNDPTEIGRIAEQGSNIFEVWPSEDTVFQFVNYHLGLHLESQIEIADLFWAQIRRIQPEIYLADCESFLTMVSRNKELFEAVRRGIS